jgi:uncharacterized protein YktA (UPF0223 family)
MNSKNSSTRNMYQIILNILILFDLVWSVIPSVASIVTSFRNKVGEIDDTAAEQQGSLKAYKTNKEQKKQQMAEKSLTMRGKVSSLAATEGNTILLGKMKISFTKLFYAKDATAIGNAEIIYDAANDLTPEQKTAAGISEDDITGLRESIDTFKELPSPIQMRVIRKANTKKLAQLFKEANLILKNSLNGLMFQFKVSNPDFFNQYMNAKSVLESHRHTTVILNAVDETGKDLDKVQVFISSDDESFQDITNTQGIVKQQISPEINYSALLKLDDYEDQQLAEISLNAGQHQKLVVVMKKK